MRQDLEVFVPHGWWLRVRVEGAAVGHGPALAFTRSEDGRPFPSLRPTWESWEPVCERRDQRIGSSSQVIYLSVLRRVDLFGTVLDLPYYPSAGSVQVAAIGSTGTWYAAVSGNGWFQFPDLPLGSYQLHLYERPTVLDGPNELAGQGRLLNSMPYHLAYPTYDLELPWSREEAEEEE